MKIVTIFRVGFALIKNIFLKIKSGHNFQCTFMNSYSPSTVITIHKGGKMSIGKHLSTLNNVTLSVAKNAKLNIGEFVNVNKSWTKLWSV